MSDAQSCSTVETTPMPPGGLHDRRAAWRRVGCTLWNLLVLPARVALNVTLLGVHVALALWWWGLLLGTTVGLLIVLIFAPQLFLWPLVVTPPYVPLWPEEDEQ